MKNNPIIVAFANCLSTFLGVRVYPEDIYDTRSAGWYYYFPENFAKMPTLLAHYRGRFFVVLPGDDVDKLLSKSVSPREYILSSNWAIGYYQGGGSPIIGAWFTPVGRIISCFSQRYARIMRCMTNARASGYRADSETCSECAVADCPFSQHKQCKDAWDIYRKTDYRYKLIEALADRISEELGFEVKGVEAHHHMPCWENVVAIEASFSPNSVSISIPSEMLMDLLYNPGERDFSDMARHLELKLSHLNMSDSEHPHWEIIDIPGENAREFILRFWMSHNPHEWVKDALKEAPEVPVSEEPLNIVEAQPNFIVRILRKLFKK